MQNSELKKEICKQLKAEIAKQCYDDGEIARLTGLSIVEVTNALLPSHHNTSIVILNKIATVLGKSLVIKLVDENDNNTTKTNNI